MKTKILSEESFSARIDSIVEEIAGVRECGTFERVAGEPVYYELYRAKTPKGWMAISHGFTESTVKYAEVIWYFLNEGYSVAICDHRGHGRSYRAVKDKSLIHVEHFNDYCDDFACFVRNVIAPAAEGLPIFLMGHSMGGAVAARLMERHPDLPIEKVILCSPMIAPATQGIPAGVTLAIAQFFIAIGKGKEMVFAHHPFDGGDDFGTEGCCALSRRRHKWYLEIQRKEERYQTCAATYSWLREALLQTKEVLKPSNLERVRVPVLLIQSGLDTMVKNEVQDKLVEGLPNARKLVLPNARHESFRCNEEDIKLFMESILDFIEE